MHICKKNKFIHEDIKAVCSSATKKLTALVLAAVVTGDAKTISPGYCRNITCAHPKKDMSNEQTGKKGTGAPQGNGESQEIVQEPTYEKELEAPQDNRPFSEIFAEQVDTLKELMYERVRQFEGDYELNKEVFELQKKRVAMLEKEIEENTKKAMESKKSLCVTLQELCKDYATPRGGTPDEAHFPARIAYDTMEYDSFCRLAPTLLHAWFLRVKLTWHRDVMSVLVDQEKKGNLPFEEGRIGSFEINSQAEEPCAYDVYKAEKYVVWAEEELKRLSA